MLYKANPNKGIIKRNFLPHWSDHGPRKRANIVGGNPFINKVTSCILATVWNIPKNWDQSLF